MGTLGETDWVGADDGHRVDLEERPRAWLSGRTSVVLFCVLEAVAVPLFLFWGRHRWFNTDDWDFLSQRTGGNVGDWLRGHNGHWVTLPVLAYRVLWLVVGLHTYVPYQMLSIVAHLVVVALLRVVMRRSGVGPWLSTIAASSMLFFGSGVENILVAFQVTFVGALAFGLTQLLLADHDGPWDRRDWLALVAGVAGLLCSGVAVVMTAVVGLVVVLRRGWRMALFHTAPIGTAYLAWAIGAPKGQPIGMYRATSLVTELKFVWIGLEAAFGGLGQVPGWGVVLAMVLVIGLATAFLTGRSAEVRARAAAPIGLLVGAIAFLAVTGVYRSGTSGTLVFFKGFGPEHARQSRYVYIVAAMVLPAIAFAADAIGGHWRQLTIPVGLALLVGLPANIHKFDGGGNPANRIAILTAPRLPLATQLPRTLQTGLGLARSPSLGWLLDSLPSGRIPTVHPPNPHYVATETLRLAFSETNKRPPTQSCSTLTSPITRVFQKGDSVTLIAGSASVTYDPAPGTHSLPRPLRLGQTLVALTGPLTLQLRSTPTGTDTAPIVCL